MEVLSNLRSKEPSLTNSQDMTIQFNLVLIKLILNIFIISTMVLIPTTLLDELR